MRNVHIGGVYYGQHNIGDEAILYSMINTFSINNNLSVSTYGSKWIDSMFPNVERHMIPVRYQKPKYGIYTVPIRNIVKDFFKVRKEIRFLRSKDLYICGGATILSDCPWYSLRTVQLAGKAKTNVYLWGVGMAEINDKETLCYIKKVLNQEYVKKIFTRDEFVKKRLIGLGINRNKIFVSYDPAIMIDSSKIVLEKYLTNKQCELFKNKNKNIVLTISGEADVVYKTPIDEIKKAIDNIQKEYDANIFLIPTGCGKQCKDMEILCKIQADLNNKYVSVVQKEFTPNDLVAFLKNVDLIISSRLHMNIFGACASTPSIGLVRNSKIIDFANLLGLPYLNLDKLDCEQLVDCAKNVLENHKNYVDGLKDKVYEMRKQYQLSLDEIDI